jgi:hypothetical protein
MSGLYHFVLFKCPGRDNESVRLCSNQHSAWGQSFNFVNLVFFARTEQHGASSFFIPV